ncbi:PEP-CTERM sorting domain-containing protein [Phycisphaerales bacterium AB-hyl4]|uniref:PEP-CTERM sorting domain-containing protein n=1 Tax=Natronomicrosphaera hydrolytica TaxID=3242702 RepID=A0ABV4UAF6_9BACT
MKSISKTLSATAVVALAMTTGAVHAAPLGGTPDGDFEAFTAPGPISLINSFGTWSGVESSNAGAAVVADTPGGSQEARLTLVGSGSANALAIYTANNSVPESFELSADLRNVFSNGPVDTGISARFIALSLDNGTPQSQDVLIVFRDSGNVDWYVPGDSGTVTDIGTLTTDYKTVGISYDVVSGAISGTFDNASVFSTTTTPGLAFNQVYFQNFRSEGTSTTEFYIDNVNLIPEPASMALLGVGSLLMLARRRRQTA